MSDQDRKIWEGVLSHLRSEHPAVCRHWFDELVPLGVQNGAFGVRADSHIRREYIVANALDGFNDAMRTVTGQLIPVRFLGPDQVWDLGTGRRPPPSPPPPATDANDPPPAAAPMPEPKPMHAASERDRLGGQDALPINPDYSFEHFVKGNNNQLAYAAARAVAEQPGHAYNPLFVYGDVGLGKTHLLQAICLSLLGSQPDLRMLYISCEGFLTRFISAVQSGRMSEFRNFFRDVDLLVIDDIQFLANRDRTQEEFFHTFNTLYQARKQIVLSSDAPPDEIPDLEARLVSRFNWGLVTDIKKPGFETRVEILRRKASMRGQSLPTEVAEEIAGHFDSNIRELEGAITRLQIFAAVKKQDITLALAREALSDLLPPKESKPPTIEVIIEAVAEYFQIKRTDILGKRKLRSVARPRQIAMYLAREMTSLSFEEIGIHFGGRDHTTVMHAVSKVRDLKLEDAEIRAAIDTITTRLAAPIP
ncbi:MAG: chromosomal replication initiator protein DnaA [Planctomycetota bacterium]